MNKSPTDVDKRVGQCIRIFRKAKQLSQTEVGNGIGVSFEQVQKYEKGTNRVGPGRLVRIAKIVDVPVSRFFENGATNGLRPPKGPVVTDLLSGPYAVETLQAFSKISDIGTRRVICRLLKSVVAEI
ncbi:MAG: helix-turn-helix transcriptional regulator [Xanthobacteraceae bacterium]